MRRLPLLLLLLLPALGGLAPGREPPPAPKVTRLLHQRDFLQHLCWSPEGKQFLLTRIHAGKMGIWTVNADGSDLKQLLPREQNPIFDGHWTPDGKKIAFVYDRLQGTDGKLQIDTMNADGSGLRNLTRHPAGDNYASWSPDGRRLAFISNRDGGYGIYVMDLP